MRLPAPLAAALVLAPPAAAWAGDYVGALRCRSCHPAEYAQWHATPHARAFARLLPDQRRDPRCTACHATAAEQGLAGVQCESCHGAGRHYAAAPVMQDAALARAIGLRGGAEPLLCERCHTADSPRLLPFDREKALPLVRHRTAESDRNGLGAP